MGDSAQLPLGRRRQSGGPFPPREVSPGGKENAQAGQVEGWFTFRVLGPGPMLLPITHLDCAWTLGFRRLPAELGQPQWHLLSQWPREC